MDHPYNILFQNDFFLLFYFILNSAFCWDFFFVILCETYILKFVDVKRILFFFWFEKQHHKETIKKREPNSQGTSAHKKILVGIHGK